MKKLISGLSALAIAAAIAPMSAFAENETGGSTNVTFDAPRNSPEYMITIPASVDLNAENPTATITAENVYLDTTKHKQINVTLDSAQYVETGASTFIAKTADGSSSVTYTIGKGEAKTGVKVGDTVAEFTANGDQVLSFSEPTGATYAGTHTETLTFGISVEDAVVVKTLTVGDVTLDYCDGDTWQQIVDRNPDKIKTTSGGGWEVRISKINGSFTSWNLCKGSTGNTNYVYADHVVDPNATYVWWE